MSEESKSGEGRSHFCEALEGLSGGAVVAAADEEMKSLLAAIGELGGKGSLTVTLKVERKARGRVLIAAEVTSKVPKEKPEVCLRYLGADGRLEKDDPGQEQFAFVDFPNQEAGEG